MQEKIFIARIGVNLLKIYIIVNREDGWGLHFEFFLLKFFETMISKKEKVFNVEIKMRSPVRFLMREQLLVNRTEGFILSVATHLAASKRFIWQVARVQASPVMVPRSQPEGWL